MPDEIENTPSDKELAILRSRVDRCKSCLVRWVDNRNLTTNAACLLLIKVVCEETRNTSLEAETKTLSALYGFLEEYIKKEFARKRESEINNRKDG